MVLETDIGDVVDAIRLRCFVTSRMNFAPSVLSDYGACLVNCRAMILAVVLSEHWQIGIEVDAVLCVPMSPWNHSRVCHLHILRFITVFAEIVSLSKPDDTLLTEK